MWRLHIVAYIVCMLLGIWGMLLTTKYIYAFVGAMGTLIALCVFPISYSIGPIYIGLVHEDWMPALWTFIPSTVGFIIFGKMAEGDI